MSSSVFAFARRVVAFPLWLLAAAFVFAADLIDPEGL